MQQASHVDLAAAGTCCCEADGAAGIGNTNNGLQVKGPSGIIGKAEGATAATVGGEGAQCLCTADAVVVWSQGKSKSAKLSKKSNSRISSKSLCCCAVTWL